MKKFDVLAASVFAGYIQSVGDNGFVRKRGCALAHFLFALSLRRGLFVVASSRLSVLCPVHLLSRSLVHAPLTALDTPACVHARLKGERRHGRGTLTHLQATAHRHVHFYRANLLRAACGGPAGPTGPRRPRLRQRHPAAGAPQKVPPRLHPRLLQDGSGRPRRQTQRTRLIPGQLFSTPAPKIIT